MSDLQNQIIDILKDGNFHSGGSLGEQLGVSRTAIWKQLQKLEDMGLPVESVKGTGYRVANGLELLAKTSIVKHLCNAKAQIPRRIEILKSVDSTNKYLHEQTDADYSKAVVFAERQTSGRGRRGKAWVSPFAANIYMSILWDFEQGAQALEGLSLGVGVAVRRALVELGIGNVGLKWPNDIYIGDKKLGGILLEMIGDPAGQCSVIVGVGINVAMPSKNTVDIDQPWTDLNSESAMPVSRNKLAANLTDHIFQLLDSFEVIGFGHYRDEWQDADAFKGRQGTIQTPRDAISGTIVGVDNRGAVQLRLPNGEVQSFIGGELSLRLAK
ncbi:MAG: bifunctional biotin--[acetyl-CoA-carboxylase] ligase/biotin operon repressor BirA [Porticoccaceae bacterium]|nr:bifunctional biotin--[acetyl-CoA-carboxylase] ligase/biotin operon repressor BirA [Porticoccaceae bacterium]